MVVIFFLDLNFWYVYFYSFVQYVQLIEVIDDFQCFVYGFDVESEIIVVYSFVGFELFVNISLILVFIVYICFFGDLVEGVLYKGVSYGILGEFCFVSFVVMVVVILDGGWCIVLVVVDISSII